MKPIFIIVDGPMGSGKTTVAKLLHPKLKRTAFVSIDQIKWAISDFVRSERDDAIVRDVLAAMCAEYLRQGISVMLAQSLKTPAMRLPFVRLAKRLKVGLIQYRLDADRKVLLERLKNRPKPKLARTPLAPSRIMRNLRLYAKHKYSGATIIDTTKKTPEEVEAIILADLKKQSKVIR